MHEEATVLWMGSPRLGSPRFGSPRFGSPRRQSPRFGFPLIGRLTGRIADGVVEGMCTPPATGNATALLGEPDEAEEGNMSARRSARLSNVSWADQLSTRDEDGDDSGEDAAVVDDERG